MVMNRVVAVVIFSLGASGCSSTIQSLTDRSITSDHFDRSEGNKLKTQSGDRRLVRVRLLERSTDKKTEKWIVCAEPFAGAIIARGAESSVTITNSGDGKDKVSQVATAVDTRADVVRLRQDAAHAWCMLRADGFIGDKEYTDYLKNLDTMAFDAMAGKVSRAAGN